MSDFASLGSYWVNLGLNFSTPRPIFLGPSNPQRFFKNINFFKVSDDSALLQMPKNGSKLWRFNFSTFSNRMKKQNQFILLQILSAFHSYKYRFCAMITLWDICNSVFKSCIIIDMWIAMIISAPYFNLSPRVDIHKYI